MPVVTIHWLQKNALKLVRKHWRISEIPEFELDVEDYETWNKSNEELSDSWITYGKYHPQKRTIEFNSIVNENRSLKQIRETLLHELCHWYLHVHNKPHKDSDLTFALELIRVGASPSGTKTAKETYKKAKAYKRKETFEIIERNDEIIVNRLRHPTKSLFDFKHDLSEALIIMHNERQLEKGEYGIFPADIAVKMVELYGYIPMPLSTFSIEIGKYSGVIDREEVIYTLNQLEFHYDENDILEEWENE